MSSPRNMRWRWLTLSALVADQASKYAVEKYSAPGNLHVVIPGLLNLVHTRNPGVAFGLLADSASPWVTLLVILFSCSVMLLLFWLLATGRAGGRLGYVGMALILGGAAGNVLDRLVRRSVTDFIDVHLRDHHWYTFNLADSAIVLGAGLVLMELLLDWKRPRDHEGGGRP